MSRQFGKLAIISAGLLCALLLAAWLRSEFRSDWIVFQRPAASDEPFIMESGWTRGGVYLNQSHGVFAAMHTTSGSAELAARDNWSMWSLKFESDQIQVLGFEYWGGSDSFLVYLPLWIPLALAATPLLWKYGRMRRNRRRAAVGFPIRASTAMPKRCQRCQEPFRTFILPKSLGRIQTAPEV